MKMKKIDINISKKGDFLLIVSKVSGRWIIEVKKKDLKEDRNRNLYWWVLYNFKSDITKTLEKYELGVNTFSSLGGMQLKDEFDMYKLNKKEVKEFKKRLILKTL